MRGDGADAVARDIEGEVDRALRRSAGGAPARGQRERPFACGLDVAALLAHAEYVAVGELLRETARLEAARQSGDDGQITRARMGLLDALELYTRAHGAWRGAVDEAGLEEAAGGS